MDILVRVVSLAVIPLALAACRGGGSPPESASPSPPAARAAAPEAAWSLIRAGALLVDVRTPAEFALGHIEGALNIPHEQIGEGIGKLGLPKDRQIVLYCRSGRRSGLAQQTLTGLGYERVVNAGGYEPLEAAEPPPGAAPKQ